MSRGDDVRLNRCQLIASQISDILSLIEYHGFDPVTHKQVLLETEQELLAVRSRLNTFDCNLCKVCTS